VNLPDGYGFPRRKPPKGDPGSLRFRTFVRTSPLEEPLWAPMVSNWAISLLSPLPTLSSAARHLRFAGIMRAEASLSFAPGKSSLRLLRGPPKAESCCSTASEDVSRGPALVVIPSSFFLVSVFPPFCEWFEQDAVPPLPAPPRSSY